MPDLQYAASHNDTMVGLRDHVLPKHCRIDANKTLDLADIRADARLKDYKINTSAGANLTKSVGPSAEFLQMPIAFNYRYVQEFNLSNPANIKSDSSKTQTSSIPITAQSTYKEAWLTTPTPSSSLPTSMCQLDQDLGYLQREISRLTCSR